jgi:hypothetical protein
MRSNRFPKAFACSPSRALHRLYAQQTIPTCRLAHQVRRLALPQRILACSLHLTRPLPEEMLHYARADTHFLLHIYDQLRNALLEHSNTHPPLPPTPLSGTPPPDTTSTLTRTTSVTTPMAEESAHPWAIVRVLARSATTAGKPYMPETPDPAGLAKRWDLQLGQGPPNASSSSSSGKPSRPVDQKSAVFEAAFWWRDRVARLEDESPVCVLPCLLVNCLLTGYVLVDMFWPILRCFRLRRMRQRHFQHCTRLYPGYPRQRGNTSKSWSRLLWRASREQSGKRPNGHST